MGDILLICEHESGDIKKYSKELAYKSSEIAAQIGCKINAVLFGGDAEEDAGSLGAFGVGKVTVYNGEAFKNFDSENCIAAVAKLIENMNPSYVFATATPIGREIMPRLAMKCDSGMATECIDMSFQDGKINFKRPVYAGKLLENVKVNGKIAFATLRPNIFSVGEPRIEKAVVEKVDFAPVQTKIKIKERVQSEAKQVDLVEANVIVSGGRAMGNADNYAVLRELAGMLNASIGASRAAVDAGYISHDHQVGQTGKTVNPTLYIACGISGAVQHLAGMKTSKIIVAINKDPDAPIFGKADFGIVGDLFKVVPAITKRLKALKGE